MVIESTVPFLESIGPNLFGILYTGPTICGFIIGFIAGLLMTKSPTKGINLTTSSWIVIIVSGLILAYWLGTFPYYGGLPLGPGFVMTIIGAIIGRGLLGTKVKA